MSLVKCCLHKTCIKNTHSTWWYIFHPFLERIDDFKLKSISMILKFANLPIWFQGTKNMLWHLGQLDITSAQGIMWHCWQRFLWKGITTFHPINLGDIENAKVLLWHGFIIFFFIVVCHFCYWGSYHKKTWMILSNFALFFWCSIHKTEWSPLIMMRLKTLKQKLSLLN